MDNLKVERTYGPAKLTLKDTLRRIGVSKHFLAWNGCPILSKELEEAEEALLEFIKEQEG